MVQCECTGDGDEEEIRNWHTLYEINDGDLHGFVSPGQHVDSFYNNKEDSTEGKEGSDLTGAEILTSKRGETVCSKVVAASATMTETLWWTHPMMSHCTLLSTRMVAYPRKVTMRL